MNLRQGRGKHRTPPTDEHALGSATGHMRGDSFLPSAPVDVAGAGGVDIDLIAVPPPSLWPHQQPPQLALHPDLGTEGGADCLSWGEEAWQHNATTACNGRRCAASSQGSCQSIFHGSGIAKHAQHRTGAKIQYSDNSFAHVLPHTTPSPLTPQPPPHP